MDCRLQVMRIIGERLVELHRPKWEEKACCAFANFEKDPSLFSEQIKKLKKMIIDTPSPSHYIPFLLFLPTKKFLFRGLKVIKGKKLQEASFNDLLLKGSGSADLSLYEDFLTSIWAKVGQMFTSVSLSYVLNRDFDKDSILLMVSSDTMNEMQLRRMIRWEKTDHLHAVFYASIKPCMFKQVFISQDKQDEIRQLTQYKHFKEDEKFDSTRKLQKIARRQLVGQEKQQTLSLISKISWLDSAKKMDEQMGRGLQTQGEEATEQEIWQENFIRQWIRERLLEELEMASPLKECLYAAAMAVSKSNIFNPRSINVEQ